MCGLQPERLNAGCWGRYRRRARVRRTCVTCMSTVCPYPSNQLLTYPAVVPAVLYAYRMCKTSHMHLIKMLKGAQSCALHSATGPAALRRIIHLLDTSTWAVLAQITKVRVCMCVRARVCVQYGRGRGQHCVCTLKYNVGCREGLNLRGSHTWLDHTHRNAFAPDPDPAHRRPAQTPSMPTACALTKLTHMATSLTGAQVRCGRPVLESRRALPGVVLHRPHGGAMGGGEATAFLQAPGACKCLCARVRVVRVRARARVCVCVYVCVCARV